MLATDPRPRLVFEILILFEFDNNSKSDYIVITSITIGGKYDYFDKNR